jgi:hypothetical protein
MFVAVLQTARVIKSNPRVEARRNPGCVSDLKAVSARRALGTEPRLKRGWRYFYALALVRARDNAGAIHIDRTQIQMTIASAPYEGWSRLL